MSKSIVQIDDLELSEYDIYKEAMYEGRPFTGTAISDGDGLHEEWTFVGGNGHGRWFSEYSNGQLCEEVFLDNGEVISEREWNKKGQLIHKMDREPLLDQIFDANGHLLKETTKEHHWTFYANGTRHEDYDYLSSKVTVFDDTGIWIVKGILTDKYWVLSPEKMTFNDDCWFKNYMSILKADFEDNYPYFIIWLKNISEIRSEIICSLIENEDLHFKYNGIKLAREYRIKDAIPLIEKQLQIKKCPPATNNTSYGWSVGYFAEQVLRDLKG